MHHSYFSPPPLPLFLLAKNRFPVKGALGKLASDFPVPEEGQLRESFA